MMFRQTFKMLKLMSIFRIWVGHNKPYKLVCKVNDASSYKHIKAISQAMWDSQHTPSRSELDIWSVTQVVR
jgi:hypothetical protein